mmetsp:Transcript_8206/g.51007  ORF Transcript_8206/g.51007 Transcript_8206/m.51007 type:complete len:438 (+) Transcript_8206:757-2070(+)
MFTYAVRAGPACRNGHGRGRLRSCRRYPRRQAQGRAVRAGPPLHPTGRTRADPARLAVPRRGSHARTRPSDGARAPSAPRPWRGRRCACWIPSGRSRTGREASLLGPQEHAHGVSIKGRPVVVVRRGRRLRELLEPFRFHARAIAQGDQGRGRFRGQGGDHVEEVLQVRLQLRFSFRVQASDALEERFGVLLGRVLGHPGGPRRHQDPTFPFVHPRRRVDPDRRLGQPRQELPFRLVHLLAVVLVVLFLRAFRRSAQDRLHLSVVPHARVHLDDAFRNPQQVFPGGRHALLGRRAERGPGHVRTPARPLTDPAAWISRRVGFVASAFVPSEVGDGAGVHQARHGRPGRRRHERRFGGAQGVRQVPLRVPLGGGIVRVQGDRAIRLFRRGASPEARQVQGSVFAHEGGVSVQDGGGREDARALPTHVAGAGAGADRHA